MSIAAGIGVIAVAVPLIDLGAFLLGPAVAAGLWAYFAKESDASNTNTQLQASKAESDADGDEKCSKCHGANIKAAQAGGVRGDSAAYSPYCLDCKQFVTLSNQR
jgi:cytochrome c553